MTRLRRASRAGPTVPSADQTPPVAMNPPIRISVAALAVGLLALAGSPSPAPAQDTIRTADYGVEELEFPPLRDFQVPEPERMVLENGMVVFLLEDHELPLVQARARIAAGSVFEPAEEAGLASVTGMVMRTGGTESMSPDSINQVLEGLGATVETSIGGTSGSAFMSTLVGSLDTVLPIFADVLREPAFAREKVALAKKQQKSAISRRNDSPRQIAVRELDKVLYGGDSPYARHPEYFTIDSISRADVVEFHEEYVHPGTVILSVWGDFETESMKERVRRRFGDWSAPEDAAAPTLPEREAEKRYSVNFIQKDDVTQSTVLMGHPGDLTRDDPDYPAVIVMNEVLSGGFSGRLFQNVRRERGLAYSVFGNYSAGYGQPGRFFAGVFSKSASTVEATEAVLHEVARMKEAAPDAEEVGLARDSYLNSFVFNFDTESEVLGRLMTYEHYGYPADFLQRTKDRIQEVSPDDVLRVSREYLYPDSSHILVVGRREAFSEDLSALTRDGQVRTIDITIPTSPPAEGEDAGPASEEERSAGREALRAAREALGGDALAGLDNLRLEEETVQQTPGGGVTIPSTTVLAMDGRIHVQQTLPNGMTITVVDDGERMMLRSPQGARPAPPQIRRQITGQLWHSLVYLLANLDREGLEVRDRGNTEVEGSSYRAVEVTPPEGRAFTLLLDPGSMRPERMTFTATSGQGPVEATTVYGDFRTVGGVTLPFRTVTYQDGEEASRSTRSAVETNVQLEEGFFSAGGDEGSTGGGSEGGG